MSADSFGHEPAAGRTMCAVSPGPSGSTGDAWTAPNGWDGVSASDVPVGAGLSSSAAFELAIARTFVTASSGSWDPVPMALLLPARGERVGRRQLRHHGPVHFRRRRRRSCVADRLPRVDVTAGRDCRRRIDCRPRRTTRRALTDSAYDERRRQCEAAARLLGVRALRDADEDAPVVIVGRPRSNDVENERAM